MTTVVFVAGVFFFHGRGYTAPDLFITIQLYGTGDNVYDANLRILQNGEGVF